MTTDLAQHIQATPLIDTHEHLQTEDQYVHDGPDVLADLFGMYIGADLITAGAAAADVTRLLDSSDPDVEARWAGVAAAWDLCQHTGYGEAVRDMARRVYGMEAITLEALVGAAARNVAIRQPGERLRLLREVANLDHVQIDDYEWACPPDAAGPAFFLYDLSWVHFVGARFDVAALAQQTGVTVHNLATLEAAIAALFAEHGPTAIAVKTQHAYERTLAWQARSATEAAAALHKWLAGAPLAAAERLCLGDWCFGKGIEQASAYNLPIKIHTGYLAGNNRGYTAPERTRAGHLAPLLAHYPAATFVLMHIAYPYSDEVLALAKHYPNAYVDMCWSWSINPYHAADFVRRALHSVPLNKVFAFGGDCHWPTEVVGFATQARRWLTVALQREVDAANLTEAQAIHVATRLMQHNQRAVFDLEGTRQAITAALG